MKTQMEYAREGKITEKMKEAAREASISPETLRDNIAKGTAIICHNNQSPERQTACRRRGNTNPGQCQYRHE